MIYSTVSWKKLVRLLYACCLNTLDELMERDPWVSVSTLFLPLHAIPTKSQKIQNFRTNHSVSAGYKFSCTSHDTSTTVLQRWGSTSLTRRETWFYLQPSKRGMCRLKNCSSWGEPRCQVLKKGCTVHQSRLLRGFPLNMQQPPNMLMFPCTEDQWESPSPAGMDSDHLPAQSKWRLHKTQGGWFQMPK